YDPQSHKLQLAASIDSRPEVFDIFSQRDALESWLSEFFAQPVTFRENDAVGFPDDLESPGPTLIGTSTLQAVADWFDLSLEQTRARFRTNLEVGGVSPFWEDRLYGQKGVTVRFRIGDVVFDGINPCQRCVVPSRDARTGAGTADFARRFVQLRRKYLPDWAESTRFNHYYRLAINTRLVSQAPVQVLQVGEKVEILGAGGTPQIAAAPPAAAAKRWTGRLRVSAVCQTTPTVRTFRFSSVEGGDLPFTYLPGQFLNIEIPIDGVVQRRCYTIASAPTHREFCELTIKREQGGAVSQFLHDHLHKGMEISASGPGGKFTFTGREADSLLLIGAGVGITPLMSVIRYLTDTRWPGSIDLLYSVKTHQEIIYLDELKTLTHAFPNLRVTTTITQDNSEIEPYRNGQWKARRGRITPDLVKCLLPDSANRRIHICGPLEMAENLRRMLEGNGVASDQIRSEAFGGPISGNGAAVAEVNCKPIGNVTFTNSGKSARLCAGQTVLDAATRCGISIDRGCLAGICGRCKVRLVSGNVAMDEDMGLADADRENGFILACQARPTGNVGIEG
ncbi:MAG TPA: 2Fe-2S iron-sulfur cluster-binding protein, partial [Tepidisphaeraceae bacterium]|nr:2Fe-2S iron-sulfur cluster-binding protein [Tepidisphaeraceae bacterium]